MSTAALAVAITMMSIALVLVHCALRLDREPDKPCFGVIHAEPHKIVAAIIVLFTATASLLVLAA